MIRVLATARSLNPPAHSGTGSSALFNDRNDGTFVDGELVGLKVPFRIRSSGCGFREQVLNRGGKPQRGERDILAEVRPDRLVERGRIAFVKGDDLGDAGWAIRLNCSCADQ